MQAIGYEFESFESLAELLNEASDEHMLALPAGHTPREGQWLLATFAVGDDSTAAAGRVVHRDDRSGIVFEERDWGTLRRFARGGAPSSVGPPSQPGLRWQVAAPTNCSVLIVDGDPAVQTVVSATLRASGFCTCSVGSAEEALDFLRSSAVDLLVVESLLPGMTGVELCRRLRKDRRLSHMPVLFLIAHSLQEDLEEAVTAGANDFVRKPFRARELRARVIGLLRRTQPGFHAS
ncbi:MAG TPA: response regulator transcription factor [Polyangiaceae bacterium]